MGPGPQNRHSVSGEKLGSYSTRGLRHGGPDRVGKRRNRTTSTSPVSVEIRVGTVVPPLSPSDTLPPQQEDPETGREGRSKGMWVTSPVSVGSSGPST